MTTLVALRRIIASDSRATIGTTPHTGSVRKIYLVRSGFLAVAGNVAQIPVLLNAVHRWGHAGYAKMAAAGEDIGLGGIYVPFVRCMPALVFHGSLFPLALEDDNVPYAAGSGGDFAEGYLRGRLKGVDVSSLSDDAIEALLREAIEFAAERDVATGGQIKVVRVPQIEGDPTESMTDEAIEEANTSLERRLHTDSPEYIGSAEPFITDDAIQVAGEEDDSDKTEAHRGRRWKGKVWALGRDLRSGHCGGKGPLRCWERT